MLDQIYNSQGCRAEVSPGGQLVSTQHHQLAGFHQKSNGGVSPPFPTHHSIPRWKTPTWSESKCDGIVTPAASQKGWVEGAAELSSKLTGISLWRTGSNVWLGNPEAQTRGWGGERKTIEQLKKSNLSLTSCLLGRSWRCDIWCCLKHSRRLGDVTAMRNNKIRAEWKVDVLLLWTTANWILIPLLCSVLAGLHPDCKKWHLLPLQIPSSTLLKALIPISADPAVLFPVNHRWLPCPRRYTLNSFARHSGPSVIWFPPPSLALLSLPPPSPYVCAFANAGPSAWGVSTLLSIPKS